MSGTTRVRNALLLLLLIAAVSAVIFSFSRMNRSRGPIRLVDVTAETGIDFVHTDGASGKHYLAETAGGGLALLDFDGDGLIDIYFVNGAALPSSDSDAPASNRLYRNLGGLKFQDVTDGAGVGDTGYGVGVAVGDYDDDGDADIYLNNFGPNVLYQNNGDGTFTDVTEQAGVGNGDKLGAGTCFLDADGDGHLDLYVANYIDFSLENHVEQTMYGVSVYTSPDKYQPLPDVLFRNNGDGSFSDVSDESGIGDWAGSSKGLIAVDVENDGDTDLFVLNDTDRNFFFRNDGSGKFEEVAELIGLAFSLDGGARCGLGVDCGDYDNDGWLDLFQTTYQSEFPGLYRNLGTGQFTDVALVVGASAGVVQHVKWGVGFVDFDNDGDRDVFVACGHLQDNIAPWDETSVYETPNVCLMNTGEGRFLNVTDRAGDGLTVVRSSRGAAFDDLDNDGDVDAVILNARSAPTVLRNDSPGGNHWLQVELEGTNGNRDGVGAHVVVTSGERTQVAEVHGGRGYQSSYGKRLYFGLGPRGRVDRLEVRWVGGGEDEWTSVAADQKLVLRQGSAAAPAELPPEETEKAAP